MNSSVSLPDLAECIERARPDLETLRASRVLITGGTGFIGTWLLATLLHANEQLRLGLRAVVFCRNPAAFRARCSDLATNPAVELVAGDVRRPLALTGELTHVIHAANEVGPPGNGSTPLESLDVITVGTRNVLECALKLGARRTLVLSSGTVYGRQQPGLSHFAEEASGGLDPLDPDAVYHEGKRVAELLTAIYAQRLGLPGVVVARIFALIGPWLPQRGHFAAGNFIRDGILGRTIGVNGDGRSVRSYLYAGDCAAWLWTLLARGRHGIAYQVGSSEAITTGELAALIATEFTPTPRVEIRGKKNQSVSSDRYVPSAERAASEFGLLAWTPLRMAIRKTIAWSRQCPEPWR